jgi:hypothetical protein
MTFEPARSADITVFQSVVDAWMQQIDQKLYLQPPVSLENTEQARDPIVRSSFTADSFLLLPDTLHTLLCTVLGFAAFEQGVDRHGVSMPHVKILLEPGNNIARFDARLDVLPIREPFFGSQPAKIVRAFAGLRLDGV